MPRLANSSVALQSTVHSERKDDEKNLSTCSAQFSRQISFLVTIVIGFLNDAKLQAHSMQSIPSSALVLKLSQGSLAAVFTRHTSTRGCGRAWRSSTPQLVRYSALGG